MEEISLTHDDLITFEADKRSGQACIRNLRITVSDILGWLASGMTIDEIIEDFPELCKRDIYASLQFAANRMRRN
jgi:uncharacterized protein (DUF433 family)